MESDEKEGFDLGKENFEKIFIMMNIRNFFFLYEYFERYKGKYE